MEKVLVFIVFLLFTSFQSIFVWIYSTVFENINVFLVNTVLGQVSVIANDMLFQKTSSNSLKKVIGSIVFL